MSKPSIQNLHYFQVYVATENRMAKLFNQPTYPEDPTQLTPAQVRSLSAKVDCDLSPENLTCDGELSGKEIRARSTLLNGVLAVLQGL